MGSKALWFNHVSRLKGSRIKSWWGLTEEKTMRDFLKRSNVEISTLFRHLELRRVGDSTSSPRVATLKKLLFYVFGRGLSLCDTMHKVVS